MRLTDRPRTLAEIRPEVEWPEQLQSVMDRALARDAEERYKSAAQFGRDFAAATQEMPASASEGATMVIGAAKVTANTAKTAQVAAPPATRVAGGAGRPASPAKGSAAAVDTPAKKSSMVPLVGGLAAAAVIGFFGYQQMNGKGAETPPADSSVTQLSGVASNDTSANSQTYQRPLPNDGSSAQMPTTSPGTAPRPAGNQTANQPAGTQPRPTGNTSQPTTPQPAATTPATNVPATTPATTPASTPSSSTARTRLTAMQRELQLDAVTAADATRVLRESAAMRTGLSGVDLGEWHFTQLLAYLVLEDTERGCPAARATAQAFPAGHPKGTFGDDFAKQYCQ